MFFFLQFSSHFDPFYINSKAPKKHLVFLTKSVDDREDDGEYICIFVNFNKYLFLKLDKHIYKFLQT